MKNKVIRDLELEKKIKQYVFKHLATVWVERVFTTYLVFFAGALFFGLFLPFANFLVFSFILYRDGSHMTFRFGFIITLFLISFITVLLITKIASFNKSLQKSKVEQLIEMNDAYRDRIQKVLIADPSLKDVARKWLAKADKEVEFLEIAQEYLE